MSGFHLSNAQKPVILDGIDDPAIEQKMRKWVQFFQQFERDMTALKGQGAKLSAANRDLNQLAGKAASKRETTKEKKKQLMDIVTRSAALNDELLKFL